MRSHEGVTRSVHGPRTDAGLVLGTAAYMSPEQARGERIDHRTDVFALGATLYEMVTGRPAFQGRSPLDTMQAVLTQPIPPLPHVTGSSAEGISELQRIVDKCAAKEADERFQGMKDLIVDLRTARRRFESSQSAAAVTSPTVPPIPQAKPRANRNTMLAGSALAVLAGVAAFVWWTGRPQPAATNPSGKPAVAVLYFENNTGDASLDWMRTGLTDMMVTDLSQSADIEVLGTDRLVQILQELKRSDDRVVSADVVREIATRAGVNNVLVGSYVKAGDTIRITARLQETQTGRIVTAERVEGAGESSVFAMVDELTRRFMSKIAELGGARTGSLLPRPGPASDAGLDRDVTDITTDSIEAYRYYVEGMNFHERGLSSQAAPLVEKAIEIDPNFAMAYAKLAVVNNNVGLLDKRDEYAKRALSLIDRLTTRERYYIEGFYYGLRPETRARSIEAYQQGLKLHPEHHASRHNLGLHFLNLERYPEGIAQYEELLRRGTSTATSYENLAEMLVETGDARRALEVADDYVRRYPDIATGHRMRGTVLVAAGRLDDARAAFEKSQALDPSDFGARIGTRSVAILQQRWADVQAVNDELARSPNPFYGFLSSYGDSVLAAVRGRGSAMLEHLDRGARLGGLPPHQRSAARNRIAIVLLRHGKPALALTQAELALVDARNRDPEFETLQIMAVAQAAVGRKSDSDATLAELASRAKILPSQREARRLHWARGEIALLSGDTATAVTELTTAWKMLPVHGPAIGPPSSHADLWFSAAMANIKGGHDAEAAQLLERLQAGYERVFAMEPYARSFFLLGQIYERRGEAERARQQYGQFVAHWKDGDLERGWIAEAQQKLAR